MSTCSKIVFKYKKDSPFFLELHTGEQKAKELKKQIEEGIPFTITIKKYNEEHKYVIEKIHSCEANEGVLVVKFDGKVYRNGKLCIYEKLEHFTHTNENPTKFFCQVVPQSEAGEITNSIKKSPQDQQSVITEEVEINVFSTSTSDSLTNTGDNHNSSNQGQSLQANTDCNTNICYPFTHTSENPSKVVSQIEQQSAAQGDKARKRVQIAEEVEVNVFSTNTSDSLTNTGDSHNSSNQGQSLQANTDCNTNICYPLGMFFAGCLATAGGMVLCFTDRPDIEGILMASTIACLLIVGIAKLCEKVSEKKQKDPDMSTGAAVKTVFKDACCFGGLANTNCKT